MRLRLLSLLAVLGGASPLMGGPPFVTDDPEPVEYKQWEGYVSSQLYHDDYGWTGTLPQTEINYGVVPNLQLHVMFSDDFTATSSSASAVGFGDIELGTKYRFIQQTKYLPDVAFYPLLEIPTASRSRVESIARASARTMPWLNLQSFSSTLPAISCRSCRSPRK